MESMEAKGILCVYRYLAPGYRCLAPEKGNFAIWNLDTLDLRATPLLAQMEKGTENPRGDLFFF